MAPPSPASRMRLLEMPASHCPACGLLLVQGRHGITACPVTLFLQEAPPRRLWTAFGVLVILVAVASAGVILGALVGP